MFWKRAIVGHSPRLTELKNALRCVPFFRPRTGIGKKVKMLLPPGIIHRNMCLLYPEYQEPEPKTETTTFNAAVLHITQSIAIPYIPVLTPHSKACTPVMCSGCQIGSG